MQNPSSYTSIVKKEVLININSIQLISIGLGNKAKNDEMY
jgi:hypothetical protein